MQNVYMAPMAGITDAVFRGLVIAHGAGLTFSEMVSAKSLVYGNKNTYRLLELANHDAFGTAPALGLRQKPAKWAVQLFGHEPEIMAEAIKKLDNIPEQFAEQMNSAADWSFDVVNINMGCPMPKVVNNGDGAALMKDPVLVGQMVAAAVNASVRPVSVKIRLGWTGATKNCIEVARAAQESGASEVIVHGRTRDQYYTGEANWEDITAVKAALRVPVIGNGDIFMPEDALYRLQNSGCDGIMIARGAMGNPWLFSRTAEGLRTGTVPPPPSKAEIVETATQHLHAVANNKNMRIEEMRKHLSWYTKGMHGSADLRRRINTAKTVGEMENLLNEL